MQYLHGLIWLQDPSLKHMEDHFYKVAKESWDAGLMQMEHCFDLIRAALNLSIYLIRRDRESAAFAVSMQLAA